MSTPRNTKAAAEAPVARTNQLSLWSMISGIAGLSVGWIIPIPFALVAVVLGHIGLVQVKRSGEEGRTYAITGLVLGYIGVFIGLVVATLFAVWFGVLIFGGAGYMNDYGFDSGMMNP